jgi:hypothetical protein
MSASEKINNLSKNFSRLVTLIGGIPFIILVSVPSLVFIGFNLYFTSGITSLIITSLGIASLFGKMLKGFLILSTALLIMMPLLRMMFTKTGGELTKQESSDLNMFNIVAGSILLSMLFLFIICAMGYIGKGITVDIMSPKKTLTNFETFINIFSTVEEKVGERPIFFVEGLLAAACFALIFFTDKAAGICLITMKDILFPDLLNNSKEESGEENLQELRKKFDETESNALKITSLSKPNPTQIEELKDLLVNLDKYSGKIGHFGSSKEETELKIRIKPIKNKLKDFTTAK